MDKIKYIFLFILLGFYPSAGEVVIQGGVHLYIKNSKQIYTLDISTGREKGIFETKEDLIRNISLSPNGCFIAAIEEKRGNPLPGKGIWTVPPIYSLIVVDTTGKILSHVKMNALRYSWSPEGNRLAFITYDPRDIDYHYKFPTGLWVLTIETNEVREINKQAWELNWAIHDSCLYYRAPAGIYRWIPFTGGLEKVPYNGIYFSPDGHYYSTSYFGEGLTAVYIYKTVTNRKLTKQLPSGLNYFFGWTFRRGHLFLVGKIIPKSTYPRDYSRRGLFRNDSPAKWIDKSYLFDVEKGKVVKEYEGRVNPWVGNGEKIVFERDGRIVLEGLPNGY